MPVVRIVLVSLALAAVLCAAVVYFATGPKSNSPVRPADHGVAAQASPGASLFPKSITLPSPSDTSDGEGEIESKGGSIKGRVLNTWMRPIEGATVYRIQADTPNATPSDDSSTKTDASGRWTLEIHEDGGTDLGVVSSGYAPALQRDIVMSASQPRTVPDIILGGNASITGQVTDLEGRPLPGVVVAVALGGEAWSAESGFLPGRSCIDRCEVKGQTDPSGAYAIRGLAWNASYKVAPVEGVFFFAGSETQHTIMAPAEAVNFTMARSVQLVVRTTDAKSGLPIPSFVATLVRKGGGAEWSKNAVDVTDGTVRFENHLLPGEYLLRTSARGYEASAQQNLGSLSVDRIHEFTVRLRAREESERGVLRVVFKDEHGTQVEPIEVGVRCVDGGVRRFLDDFFVERSGEIRDLAPGHYQVEAAPRSSYGLATSLEADIHGGKTTTLELVMHCGGVIVLDAKDINGRYLPGVLVQVKDEKDSIVAAQIGRPSTLGASDQGSYAERIDRPGSVRSMPLAPGTYSVTVAVDGCETALEEAVVRPGEDTVVHVVLRHRT